MTFKTGSKGKGEQVAESEAPSIEEEESNE